MKSIQDCPVCGTPLLVVDYALVTLEDAQEMEMEARYELKMEAERRTNEPGNTTNHPPLT